MVEVEPAPQCPRCRQRAVIVDRPVASACVPFPEIVALRCEACGEVGTRVTLGGRPVITWGAPIRR